MRVTTDDGHLTVTLPRLIAIVGVLLLVPAVMTVWQLSPWVAGILVLFTPGLLLLAIVGVERLVHR